MSELWPKINPVDFDPSTLSDKEQAALNDAYIALLRNPAFLIILQDIKDHYARLTDVDYLLKIRMDVSTAVSLRSVLSSLVNLDEYIRMAQVSSTENEELPE